MLENLDSHLSECDSHEILFYRKLSIILRFEIATDTYFCFLVLMSLVKRHIDYKKVFKESLL